MASQVSIANRAIGELGHTFITSFTDGSKAANLLNQMWADIVKEVLAAYKWTFAKKWASVAADGSYTMPDDDWLYAYEIPTDFLRLSKLENRKTKFARRGNFFLSNQEAPFVFEYIWYITDTTLWPQYFIDAIVGRLKSVLSSPLSTKTRTVENNKYYLKEYYEIVLPIAMTRDGEGAFGETEEDKGTHTASNDTFLAARTS